MDDRHEDGRVRGRGWKFVIGLLTGGLGAAMAAVGFISAGDATGDLATRIGVMTGIGFGLFAVGALIAWTMRPNGPASRPERRGERLQAQRSMMLWIFPVVTFAFLFQATRGLIAIAAGEGDYGDYLSVSLPVIYAWLAASVTMGWDANSRKHRRYLEDELTLALRARATVWAFLVLMSGVTVALGIGLWRPELGIAAIPFALAAAGATAGIRFAWLDREAGKDG